MGHVDDWLGELEALDRLLFENTVREASASARGSVAVVTLQNETEPGARIAELVAVASRYDARRTGERARA